jgi:hypothetical protein
MSARDVSQGYPRQVLHAVATVVLAFAVMASVSAFGLFLLGADPRGALTVAAVAAASGGAVGLTATLSGDVSSVRFVGLEGELAAMPLGVAIAGALTLAAGLLWPLPGRVLPGATLAVRAMTTVLTHLSLLAVVAVTARGTIPLDLSGRFAGEIQLEFAAEPTSTLLGGLCWILTVPLLCLLVSQATFVRPAVLATVTVIVGLAALGVLVAVAASVTRGDQRIAGAALLGAPNAVFAAISSGIGVPWSAAAEGELVNGLIPRRLPGSGTDLPAGWPVALVSLLVIGLLAAALTPRSGVRRSPWLRPALRLGLSLSMVMAVATPLMIAMSHVSADAVIEVFGRTIPAVHLGFGGEVFPAIWRGAASGMVVGFAGSVLVDLVRRVRRAGPYPREEARLENVGR